MKPKRLKNWAVLAISTSLTMMVVVVLVAGCSSPLLDKQTAPRLFLPTNEAETKVESSTSSPFQTVAPNLSGEEKPLRNEPVQGVAPAEELPPQEASPIQLCDLDWDGDCDEDDRSILADSFGKCRGEPGYNFEADIDGDGCVTTRDERAFSAEASAEELPPQEASPIQLCDLDWDGDCDEDDRSIFDDSFGKCRGEPGYNFDADINGDGCVTTPDERAFSAEAVKTRTQ